MKKTKSADELINIVRELNPRKDILNISTLKEMIEYLKYTDLPNNFEIVIKDMWEHIEPNYNKVKKRFYKTENSIEVFHELIIGNSLRAFCEANSLKIVYESKIKIQEPDKLIKREPDWMIQREDDKVFIEVVTLNKSDIDSERRACISLIKNQITRSILQSQIDMDKVNLTYNTSRFLSKKVRKKLLKNDEERDNILERYCDNVAMRIIDWFYSLKMQNGEYYQCKEYGFEVRLGGYGSIEMTRGVHETYRITDSVLKKVEKYKSIIKSYPMIIAVANSNWTRTKTITQSDIAKIIYETDYLLLPEYICVSDKKSDIKLMLEIKKHQESIRLLPGILFYDMGNYNNIMPTHEYYVNPDCENTSTLLKMINSYLLDSMQGFIKN